MKKKQTPLPPAPAQPLVPPMTLTQPVPQPAPQAPVAPQPNMSDIADKLDRMLLIMKKHERRERMRSWGRAVHSIVWFVLVFGSSWYLYAYGPELMEQIAESAAKSASKIAEENSANIMQRMQDQIPSFLQ